MGSPINLLGDHDVAAIITRPGKHTKSELENGPFIVDLPIKHGGFP